VSNLARIRKSVATASIAAWVLAAAPAGYAATASDQAAGGAQKAGTAADSSREETELRNAVRANPNDPDAHIKLARHYLNVGNFSAAEAEAREARRSGGSDDDTVPLLAWVLLAQNKTNQLITQIKPADREPTGESTVRLSLGLAHFHLREFDAAEPLLRDAARLDPDSWRAHLGLARFFLFKGQLPAAREQIEAARAIASDEIAVIRLSGELRRAEGDTDGAIAEFGKVIHVKPNNVPALADRADALLSQDKLPEARRDVDAALKGGPKNPQTNYLSALILARQGNLAEADAKLTSIGSAVQQMRTGYYLRGAVKFWRGQYEQADADLSRFLARQPDASGARRLRAEIALRRKDPARAIELLKPALQANPTDQGAATVLARAYVASGHPDQALELLEHVAEAQPENQKAQPAAAVKQVSDGNAAEGTAEIEKFIASQQGADTAAPLLVLAELRRGDVEKASSVAEALAKRTPDDPIIRNLLGSVQLAQKRLPEAEAIFRDIVKKTPEFTTAARNLAQVLVAEQKPDEAKAVLEELAQRNPKD
jgi:cellulose synthase operon protein C